MKRKRQILSPQMRLKFDEEERVRREVGVQVRCVQCRKMFTQPQWYVDKGIQSQFCSAACRSNWDLESFDKPFELQLDGLPEHRGGNWKTQSRLARERDGYRCQRCGMTEEELGRQLDVHHKVPFRLFDSPLDANRLSNLISVCPSCHKRIEEAGRDDMPLFEAVKHPGQSQ